MEKVNRREMLAAAALGAGALLVTRGTVYAQEPPSPEEAARMTPRVRKFALTAHVTSSVGWLGAVLAYVALAIAGLTSHDAQLARSTYLALELIGWFVIVPLSLATLLTGLVQSLGTEWGLVRHYWVFVKLLLTIGATTILLLHMPRVSGLSAIAAGTTWSSAGFVPQRVQLVVHAAGGLFVLLTTTILSIFKPWGRTAYGRRTISVGVLNPVSSRTRRAE